MSFRRATAFAAAAAAAILLPGCGALHENARPVCRYGPPTVIMAQSVPSATMVPCVGALPLGWHFRSFDAEAGRATFILDSEAGGDRALAVTLQPRCDVKGFSPAPSDEPGASRFGLPARSGPVHIEEWAYTFAGGCALYRFSLKGGDAGALTAQAARGVSFMTRRSIASAFLAGTGHRLDSQGDGK